ncbi:MAG: mannose-1-phosphate guanylyltransferase [Bacilli bacterium]|nr:mannose-1-phosphate guanylyltransferase [Bacilli bacterium]
MRNVVVIMAGGKGERFWPMSRISMPKQFLNLIDAKRSMIQLTVDRIKPLVDTNDIYIVTNINYKDIVLEQLPNVPRENILFEPVGRNTAPCIGLACAVIKKRYVDANIIVLSSDHMIENETIFLENLKSALVCAESDNIVTLGIIPNRIETGYGYIKLGDKTNFDSVYKALKFVEKPSYDVAKKYYESKLYLWNSGMFIFKNETMWQSFSKYMPYLMDSLNKIYSVVDTCEFLDVLDNEFKKMESISIDYGIMEHADNIYVVPCSSGWDDVGSWLSVSRLRNKDVNNNINEGNNILLDCKGNIIINNTNKLIASYGMEDFVIINTDDIILIMPKDKTPDIKNLIGEIKKNKKDYL